MSHLRLCLFLPLANKAEGGAAGSIAIKKREADGTVFTKLILDNQGNRPRVG